jgi:hypothetical protein
MVILSSANQAILCRPMPVSGWSCVAHQSGAAQSSTCALGRLIIVLGFFGSGVIPPDETSIAHKKQDA